MPARIIHYHYVEYEGMEFETAVKRRLEKDAKENKRSCTL